MLLGNRPRPPTRRTTSSTEFLAGVLLDIELPQLPDPEGSIGGEAIDPHLGVAQGSIAGVGVDWRAARFLGSMLSPRGGMQRELFVSPETVGFLRACGLCNRRLGPGRDAFMYRNFSFYFLQAVDVVFSGTAPLSFGISLYVMFVSSDDMKQKKRRQIAESTFGSFNLKKLAKSMGMQSISDAKSRLGHSILLILQAGMVEKLKEVELVSGMDLACFAGAVFVSSACVFILSKLSIPRGINAFST